jgi:hypothetical protein
MASNIERFRSDIARLIHEGDCLWLAMTFECFPDERAKAADRVLKARKSTRAKVRVSSGDMKVDTHSKIPFSDLPSFTRDYQKWYSEALGVIRQLLPDRVADFQYYYEIPRTRKALTHDTYRIADYLQGLTVRNSFTKEVIVGPSAAIVDFKQQNAILAAAAARLDSSLYDIRQLVQADLFDSEIDAAEHLNKAKFHRAAGAVAGVVLEKHLAQVCLNHALMPGKKNPTISTFNDALKAAGTIDVATWRFIQHLGDLRNLCDHAKGPEPTSDQVSDLTSGTRKAIKTIF